MIDNITDALTDAAIEILASGEPLPVDMTARLLEAGVDVAALEARWAA